MKQRPILFNPEMVRAVLNGSKTETRRVIKPQPPCSLSRMENTEIWTYTFASMCDEWKCPHGKIGDQIYVKETYYAYGKWVKNGITKTGKQAWKFTYLNNIKKDTIRYIKDRPFTIYPNNYRKLGWYKRNSLFMPKWASRIQLEITNINVERVQDITEEGAIAEGVKDTMRIQKNGIMTGALPTENFQELWNSINEKRGYSWDSNPFVWVVKFKVVK